VTDQLALFAELDTTAATSGSGTQLAPQNGERELRRGAPAGAERLLRALVRQELREGDLRVAAALCIVLDEGSSR
jgi:hypothetical protein